MTAEFLHEKSSWRRLNSSASHPCCVKLFYLIIIKSFRLEYRIRQDSITCDAASAHAVDYNYFNHRLIVSG